MDVVMQHSVQKHVFCKNNKISMNYNGSVGAGMIIKTRRTYLVRVLGGLVMSFMGTGFHDRYRPLHAPIRSAY